MKKILLTCFMLVFVLYAWAQDRTVSGKVTDADTGEGLPGVNVLLKGTGTGITTDLDGNYKISVPSEGGTLVFTFIGMEKQEVPIGSRSVIDIQMETDVQQLSEVVVTGYKTVTKEKSNISSVTLSSEKISNRPNPSVVQSLQGQVPGLSITTSTGQPGGASTINLRGVGSINGNTEPLFIIDGTPVDGSNFRSINPNEIESISVLKDAGATAIYGNRGANGVIVIETKAGSFDQDLQVTYTGQYISNQLQDNDYRLLSSPQQLRLEREYGSGIGTGFTDAEIDATETFDWANYFFDQGIGQNHNLQFRGGGENSAGYLSLGYLNQEGILQNSSLERYNLRTNLNGKSGDSKFKYGINLSVNYSENNEPGSLGTGGVNQNYVLGAYQSVPYISADDYTDSRDLLAQGTPFRNTPLFLIDKLRTFTRLDKEVKALSTLNLSYEIIDGLTISTRTSADYTNENFLSSQAPISFNSLLFAQTGNETPGRESQQFRQEFTWNQLTSVNYGKSFGLHSLNVGLYNEMFKANLNTFGFTNEGLNPKTYYPGDGSGYVADNSANDFYTNAVNANILSQSLLSYFGQVDYDYDSKYGLTATLRRDASSRFIGDNKWGNFYSIAGRWNIHNEAFMDGLPFDALKLRGSYGTNGNQDITNGGYFATLDNYRAQFATVGGYGGAQSLQLGVIPNTTLRWETITQSNIAIDMEMFRSRLRATVEGYIKTTSDLFLPIPVSAVNGVTTIDGNFGSLSNSGVDLMLGVDVLRSDEADGLNLTLNFVGNYNKQEVLELPGGEEEQILANGNILRVGGILQQYYDYRYQGVNPANGNMLFLTADGEVTENPDPAADRVALGQNIYPEYQGSFGLDVSYKGFFAQANFTYFSGVDRYDFDYSGFMDPTSIGQFRHSTDILRAWTPDNRVTDVPALNATNLQFQGTRFLRDADYVRLRFLSVGYNVPQKWMNNIGLRMGRVFVNGENLFTLTEWRGFDAEALSNTSRIYPTPRTITVGVELGF